MYPTRHQKIGEIHCIFFSSYKQGRRPLLTVGPSILPLLFMLCFTCFAIWYLCFLIEAFYQLNFILAECCYLSLVINVFTMILAVLGDPGIEQSIYDHYNKYKFKVKIETENEE